MQLQGRLAEAAESGSDQEDGDGSGSEDKEDDFEARHRRAMAETAARPAVIRPSTQVKPASSVCACVRAWGFFCVVLCYVPAFSWIHFPGFCVSYHEKK